MEKATKFNNLNELTGYLTQLENRIVLVESENKNLREVLERMGGETRSLAEFIREMLPKTALFSRSFIARAFTVWGHYFVAQLIIGIVLSILWLLIALLIFGSLQNIPLPPRGF